AGPLQVVGRGAAAVVEREDAVAMIGQDRRRGLPIVVHVREGSVDQHHGVRVLRGRSAGPVVGSRGRDGGRGVGGQGRGGEVVVHRQVALRRRRGWRKG